MKNLITAAVLVLASNVVAADSFAPWETRAVIADTLSTTQAEVAPIGFAPWRDRDQVIEMAEQSVRFGDTFDSGFRPWS